MQNSRLSNRLLTWLPRSWAAIDAEAATERAADPQLLPADDRRMRQLLVVAALLLALGYSVGDRIFFAAMFGDRLEHSRRFARYADLISYTYWAWAKLLGYGLLPLLHLRLLGQRIGDYGLRAAHRPDAVPWRYTYLSLFALILPALVVVSRLPSFRDTYPFYRGASLSLFDFAAWEGQYLLTFVAVEFFFRGYLLFGMRRRLGSLTIFVSMVPYCMIHILKPPAEAFGSIATGILLGTLALRTGSIWCGVLLHVSVALSMDVLALWQAHQLPLQLLR